MKYIQTFELRRKIDPGFATLYQVGDYLLEQYPLELDYNDVCKLAVKAGYDSSDIEEGLELPIDYDIIKVEKYIDKGFYSVVSVFDGILRYIHPKDVRNIKKISIKEAKNLIDEVMNEVGARAASSRYNL